ncbi:undecaprenyl-phosphate glucose phosphotransferase [Chitinispirillum alkaliphilum]|nr:undecaprenyl-phosphate glucose phosphotransferase [Chitinispirillum alkaliphilum]
MGVKLDRSTRFGRTADSLSSLIQEKWDFCDERSFRRNLTKERMRAERTLRPFLLVFIHLNGNFFSSRGVNGPGARRSELLQLVSAVCQLTRDIDVRGWYESGRIIGVVCPEISSGGKECVLNKLRRKVDELFGSGGDVRITVSGSDFPKRGKKDGESGERKEWDSPLYFYPVQNSLSREIYLLGKRVIDIAGSLAALIFFSPFFLLIALFIKLGSDGPVFFVQKRVGHGGKLFNFYKFRSMYIGADDSIHREYVSKLIGGEGQNSSEHAEDGVYKITKDPRVTPVGRLLRKSSLDELPQFINVLLGDMSLVGPRPAIPYEFEQYEPWHRARIMEQKPGITGLWQVEGRSHTTFDEMVRMDLRYCRSFSLWVDMWLIVKTPFALLSAKGAF